MSKIGKDALIEKPVEKQKQKTAEQQKPANFKAWFEPMCEEDLPAVRELNNQHSEAVGEITLNKLKFLFKNCQHAFVCHEQDMLVAFCIVFSQGSIYDSRNYQWFSQNYDSFVYMDRIVVSQNY